MPAPSANNAAFQPTRWSLVLQARGTGVAARKALEDLCAAYWFPLYSWARRVGVSPEDAEDFVQGFFVEVLEHSLFSGADPELGKLRTFLLTAFRRHVRDEQVKAGREKRGGGKVVSFDAAEAEAWFVGEQIEGESADAMFDRQWALTVLDRAVARLEAHAVERGKAREFEALRPFLNGDGGTEEYERGGAQLGLSGNSFKVAVHRLRSRFREAVRAEVAETQPEGADTDEEMRHLMWVLRGE